MNPPFQEEDNVTLPLQDPERPIKRLSASPLHRGLTTTTY